MWAVIQLLRGPHPYLSHTALSVPPTDSGSVDTLKVFLLGVLAGGGAHRQAGLHTCVNEEGSRDVALGTERSQASM